MPTSTDSPSEFQPGDYYEDCAFHPCVCISTSVENDEIMGISLADGTFPRSCSPRYCGVRKLTFAEAVHWRFFGPSDQTVSADKRWWYDEPKEDWLEPFRHKPQNIDGSSPGNSSSR